jgi:hypothetical protein
MKTDSDASITIVAVHLPAHMHGSSYSPTYTARTLSDFVRDLEARLNSDRTLVIGDFNMDVFHDGLIACDALHAVPTRAVAGRGERTVQGKGHPMFYNPM